MYTIRVDYQSMAAQQKAIIDKIKAFNKEALRLSHAAADEEKDTKTYQNRTGKLVGGTKAERTSFTPDGWVIVLQQGAFYGVYVQARGFSEFSSIAINLGKDIAQAAAAL